MSKTSNKFCVEEDNSAEEETLQKNIKVEHEDIFRKLHKKYSETAKNTKNFYQYFKILLHLQTKKKLH